MRTPTQPVSKQAANQRTNLSHPTRMQNLKSTGNIAHMSRIYKFPRVRLSHPRPPQRYQVP